MAVGEDSSLSVIPFLEGRTAVKAVTTAPGPRIRRGRDQGYRFRVVTFDIAALVACAAIANLTGGEARIALWAPPVILVLLRALGTYGPQPAPSVTDQIAPIATASAGGSLVAGGLLELSASAVGFYAIAAALVITLARGVAFELERRRRASRKSRVILVGTGGAGNLQLADRLLRHPEYGMHPVGFVDSVPMPVDPETEIPFLGAPEELPRLVLEFGVDRIVVDSQVIHENEIAGLLHKVSRSGVDVAVLPSLAPQLSAAVQVESVAGLTLLAYRPSRHDGMGWLAKRVLDVVVSSVLLVVMLPVLVLIALAIKIDTRGPVLFRQTRVGRREALFGAFKFRSMVPNAEDLRRHLLHHNQAQGPYFKIEGDPRVTRVGRFLRRTSLDELPQLLNVLAGDMSLVGPRPPLPEEVAAFPDWFRHRFEVPPGMTGLWQVSGRFLLPFHEATRLDVFYVDHWSFALDLKILLRTPWVVLLGRGAR
ncbi:MAG TPA: sugar transferase [Acidimicrobiales bacterium]|nr:sugar transferase [Acidimicrobiales bacterium]